MKKLLTILSVLSALVSCAPQGLEVLPNDASGRLITLKASFEEPPTKTTLVDGTKVYWLPGDEISVFTKNTSARFTAGIQKASATSEFTGTLPAADKYYAFYPYSTTVTYDGSVIKAQIPSAQPATKDNVANGLLLSAGVSSSDGSILFRNLVSGICFTLESEGVKFVELLGNKGEAIAGDIRVTVDESAVKTEIPSGAGQASIRLSVPEGQYLQPGVPYYIICAPTVFSEGLTLTMVKDNDLSASCKIGGPVELKRSTFGRINQADKGLIFQGGGFPEGALPPDNEIWYTTSDNKPLGGVLDQPGLSIQSHSFSNGMGVVRFSGPLTSFYQLASYNEGADRLTGILIPDSVEYLGSSLLWDSNQIREFRIPARLAAASPGCFINPSPSLERFTGHHVTEDGRCVVVDGILLGFAPAGLDSYAFPAGIAKFPESVCCYSTELRSAVLPSGVVELGDNCFSFTGLESITIPASVKSIHHYAFNYCNKLTNLLGDSPFISADRKFLFDPGGSWPMMLFLFAGKNDESYAIPSGIQSIEHYAFYHCERLRSLTFPESLTWIQGNAFSGCPNLETLEGSHVTSDHKGFVNNGHKLQFLVPSISDDYRIPDEVTSIGDLVFQSRPTLRSVTMGDQVVTIGNYAFQYCPALKTITLSANLSSFGFNPFYDSPAIEAVYFRSILPPAYSDTQPTPHEKMKFYVPAQSLSFYKSSAGWKDYWNIMEPYDYTDLPEPDFYISKDYSKEGEVTVYQKASEGNGIDFVIMGDAFSDREVASGKYQAIMKECAEAFFTVEPYKSFRHLFNVYFVTTVSATEGYSRGGQSLGTYPGMGTAIGGNDAKCFELAQKAVKDPKRMDEVLVLVCGNQELGGVINIRGTCYWYYPDDWAGRDYASGPAVTYFLNMGSLEENASLIHHEAGGHGFAKLADEYCYSERIRGEDIEMLKNMAPYRWYSNVDITSDPAKVKWAAFLADERYKYDGLGLFEGGLTYQYGVWRPTETSIMLNNQGVFNAPSRYTIWYRIHKLAFGKDWNGTYEDFVAYDAINRKTAPTSVSTTPRAAGLSQRPAEPVVTGRSWREARSVPATEWR